MQAYEAWRAVVRCVPFGPGFKVLTAVSHRLGAREGYCGTGGYTCTLARAGFRPGSVLLEASEVQFVHEYKIRLRPDTCWAPEASSNTEPSRKQARTGVYVYPPVPQVCFPWVSPQRHTARWALKRAQQDAQQRVALQRLEPVLQLMPVGKVHPGVGSCAPDPAEVPLPSFSWACMVCI